MLIFARVSLKNNHSNQLTINFDLLVGYSDKALNKIDCRQMVIPFPPPPGNFADIPYLKEQSFLHRIRDVCTLQVGA